MSNNRFYVYGHFDMDGNLVYIGSGTKDRIISKVDRSEEHLSIWKDLDKKIILDNLTMLESRSMEQSLINEYLVTGKLLNKKLKVSVPRDYDYRYFESYLQYEENSPSGLVWINKTSPQHRLSNNSFAGTLNTKGYWLVGIGRRYYSCHRIIYSLCHKVIVPHDLVIDHIDRNKSNNIITNLRLTTSSINARNRGVRSDNKTSVTGVRWCKTLNKYYVIWVEDFIAKSKAFNPSTLYPEYSIDVAKSLAFKDAIKFKEGIDVRITTEVYKEIEILYNAVSQY